MKELFSVFLLSAVFVYGSLKSGLWNEFQDRAQTVHKYEYKALALSAELRNLQRENIQLQGKLARVKAEREHMLMTSKKGSRSLASIRLPSKNDLVKFRVYKWAPEKLLGVGSRELHFKNFEKSAQFYNALVKEYPKYSGLNDKVLFEAGIAAYESKKHYDWAQSHFKKLVKSHPRSKYRRGAKLWMALSQYHQGDEKKFMQTVEEFRSKYRNSKEWKLLSKYYEDLAHKYQKKN